MTAVLYDLWNKAVLDSQHYLDGECNWHVKGIKPIQVYDFKGNCQPGLLLSVLDLNTEPTEKGEVFAVGTTSQEDTRFNEGAEEALNFNELDALFSLFGYDRESFLLAQGFENDRVVDASILSAVINYNNADDPYLALRENEIQTFESLLADLKNNGLKTDFSYVVPIPDSCGAESYHVVFTPETLKEYPSFDDLQSKDLTYEQQEVWNEFLKKIRGATIDEKQQAVKTCAEFLPDNLLVHAQKWLEQEKLLAEKLGTDITDPFPADCPGKTFELGLPTFTYEPYFFENESGSTRTDTLVLSFEASLSDPNENKLATVPISLTYFSFKENQTDYVENSIYGDFSTDRNGNRLSLDDPVLPILLSNAEGYLKEQGQTLADWYRIAADEVFAAMPSVYEIRRSKQPIQYVTDDGVVHETTYLMPGNLSKTEQEAWFKAALLEKLPSEDNFKTLYLNLLKTEQETMFPNLLSDNERIVQLSDVIGDVAITDGKNVLCLAKKNIIVRDDYLSFCVHALQGAKTEVCSLAKSQEQSQTQTKPASRGR